MTIEIIENGDLMHRLIDYPRMFSGKLLIETLFEFQQNKQTKNYEGESLVWSKHAQTDDAVHTIALEREKKVQVRKPNMKHAGFASASAGEIRNLRTRFGHRFEVVHKPTEGVHHAEVGYLPAVGFELTKSERSELKLLLNQLFAGRWVEYSG